MPKNQKRKLPSFNRGKKQIKQNSLTNSSLPQQSNERPILSQDGVVQTKSSMIISSEEQKLSGSIKENPASQEPSSPSSSSSEKESSSSSHIYSDPAILEIISESSGTTIEPESDFSIQDFVQEDSPIFDPELDLFVNDSRLTTLASEITFYYTLYQTMHEEMEEIET